MPRGDKSSYTNKQKRQAEHIERATKDGRDAKERASRVGDRERRNAGGKGRLRRVRRKHEPSRRAPAAPRRIVGEQTQPRRQERLGSAPLAVEVVRAGLISPPQRFVRVTRAARRAGSQLAIVATATVSSPRRRAPADPSATPETAVARSTSRPARQAPLQRDAGSTMRESLAHDQADHVARLCAERDAPHLVRSLRDVVRDHAVETDRREHERERSEDREHQRAQLPRADLTSDDGRHRRDGHVRAAVEGGWSARRTSSALFAAEPRCERRVRPVRLELVAACSSAFPSRRCSGDGRLRRCRSRSCRAPCRVDADAFADRVLVRPDFTIDSLATITRGACSPSVASNRRPRENPRPHRREETGEPACSVKLPSLVTESMPATLGRSPTSTGTER